jgi:hypothetical protein
MRMPGIRVFVGDRLSGWSHVMLSEERAKHPVLGNMNEILRSTSFRSE